MKDLGIGLLDAHELRVDHEFDAFVNAGVAQMPFGATIGVGDDRAAEAHRSDRVQRLARPFGRTHPEPLRALAVEEALDDLRHSLFRNARRFQGAAEIGAHVSAPAERRRILRQRAPAGIVTLAAFDLGAAHGVGVQIEAERAQQVGHPFEVQTNERAAGVEDHGVERVGLHLGRERVGLRLGSERARGRRRLSHV